MQPSAMREWTASTSRTLVAPHHGPSSAVLLKLVRRAGPPIVVIGGDGSGGGREAMEAIRGLGIEVLATWEAGAVRAAVVGGQWRVVGTGPGG
jgi:hypothetical protein